MKRSIWFVFAVLLIVMLLVPAVALAATGSAPPTMETIAAFMLPFAWLVPVTVSVVNRAKKVNPNAPGWEISLLGCLTAIAGALIFTYFAVMPEALRVTIAGVVVWLSASGFYDMFKMLGTFTTPADGGGAGA